MATIQRVRKSSIYALLGRLSEQVAAVIITWLLIKKLTLEEFGVYNLLLGTTAYLSLVSSLGLIPAFQRYLPEFFQKKEYSKFFWTVKFGLIFRTIFAMISVSIIVLLFNKIGPFFQIGDYFNYFVIFAIGIVFLLQAHLLQRVLEAMFLHQYAVYAQIVHALIRLSLLSTIFYLRYGLLHVIIVDSITYFVLLGLCFLFYKLNNIQKLTSTEQHQNFSRLNLLKRLFRYSGFSIFNQIGKNFIDISTDIFVISHYLGPAALGYYSFGARIGRLIGRFMPSRMLRSVVTPTFFARYAESGNKKELDRMFHFMSKLNAFLIFPIFTLAAVFGREIIQYVFDAKYLVGYPVMVILFIHFLLGAFQVGLPLQAVEKPEMMLIAKLSSIYNLIMDIILIQFWGIVGVAIATSSAVILKKTIEYAMSRKYAGITFPWRGISKIILNCLVIGALGIWAKQFVTDIFSLVIICILAAIAYLGISRLNTVFLEEERSLINKVLGKPYFAF